MRLRSVISEKMEKMIWRRVAAGVSRVHCLSPISLVVVVGGGGLILVILILIQEREMEIEMKVVVSIIISSAAQN